MVLHKVAKNTGAKSAALRRWRKDFVEQMHPGDVLKAAPDAGRKARSLSRACALSLASLSGAGRTDSLGGSPLGLFNDSTFQGAITHGFGYNWGNREN
jgi:hypothetical protein